MLSPLWSCTPGERARRNRASRVCQPLAYSKRVHTPANNLCWKKRLRGALKISSIADEELFLAKSCYSRSTAEKDTGEYEYPSPPFYKLKLDKSILFLVLTMRIK